MTAIANILELPKLELHIHLEGCIPLSFIEKRCRDLNIDLPRPLDDFYPTHDLGEFLSMLDWVCSLVHSETEAEELATQFGEYCRDQNIIYCEVIVNPTHWANLDYQILIPSLAKGFDRVQQTYGIDIRILPSVLRQQSADDALALAEWISKGIHPRIIGISIDGNEKIAGNTGEKFAPAFKLVRQNGLSCTAHAGESSGPSGVKSALDDLLVHRIDHGVRVVEDEQLTERVIQERIPLNVCVSSNCHLLYKNIGEHPFKTLREKGVLMTLNTDDPVVLKTNLSKELAWIADNFSFDIKDLAEFQRNAVEAAFCSQSDKQQLLDKILAFESGL
jgi:adenosine deaminase